MNNEVANIVKGFISGLSFIDKIAGMVHRLELREKITDELTVTQFYPISCDVTDPQECVNNGRYLDLVPNSKNKSVLYFEDLGISSIGTRGKNEIYQSSLRLVCWLNGQKLGKTDCSTASEAIKAIINALPRGNFNNAQFNRTKIRVLREVPKTKQIFGIYTYDESQQYLIYPYDYFALDIQVSFHLNRACLTDFVPGVEDPCNVQ